MAKSSPTAVIMLSLIVLLSGLQLVPTADAFTLRCHAMAERAQHQCEKRGERPLAECEERGRIAMRFCLSKRDAPPHPEPVTPQDPFR
ncbi:hypothetical protein KUW19_10100 [Ferrimonas balearica]|uniref:hypothetical protein n=1 Tax=Ferrimonas balearica TaxID=44012 RepID=UPI001C952E60|nr:hypothetical protein [Ferrimonas balearica]MBY6106825.1 hypothetical protein [Ferrimonas balearica]